MAFWADSFGGGRQYHGSDFRVTFHHTHNAKDVMTAAGARRWMQHMAGALNEDIDFSRCGQRSAGVGQECGLVMWPMLLCILKTN